jgi:transposase InsO family protein
MPWSSSSRAPLSLGSAGGSATTGLASPGQRPGRPRLAKAVQDLIREISSANPRWGSPRIVGELSKWTANQVSEAFPWEAAPRTLIRDRDRAYGLPFRAREECMGIEEVLTAPRSPWQNPFVERVIGSVRRECLDQVLVLDERHLRRLLGDYFEHYHRWRCHRSLAMDCPAPRPVQGPERGHVVEVAEASGLYRHHERRAA